MWECSAVLQDGEGSALLANGIGLPSDTLSCRVRELEAHPRLCDAYWFCPSSRTTDFLLLAASTGWREQ